MANPIRPSGFSPVDSIVASGYNSQANTYFIPSSDGSAYYVGDPVKSVANGDATGVPAVQKCASGDAPRGVIVGIYVSPPVGSASLAGATLSLELFSIPATKTKGYYVMVCDDPNVQYAIQDDGLSALTATSCNKNASYTVAAPTSPQQLSGTTLTTASVATTNTLALKIMGLRQSVDNAFGVNATWIVKFNNHEMLGATAGV
jgi:hypothetical protein